MPERTGPLLRVPLDEDAVAWHRLFDDPEVMRYIGTGLVRDLPWYEAFVGRQQQLARDSGLCLFSLVVDSEVVGFAGVQPWGADWGPTGELEIGWRLGRAHWGRGRATTAARAVVQRARSAGVPHLVALVHEANAPSLAVAHRLGMAPEDLLVSPEGLRVHQLGLRLGS
ncbi:GNAT family N-acetyltransferase [Blastococcus saxobsidens]|uniref:RimJ/RimL family protein N-acetyltransferase n=1 Tax=Blastococcus saxobsidens TaxID=138336 RepID=A0A4Q7Y8A7_9ACTN|nr:GNAT family N-acetyltransferase [Blastococcus saxobsidens]RZU32958.1 RimJ/RimL family protein N-acetyltransferase [Blastococcus saxobsidens]